MSSLGVILLSLNKSLSYSKEMCDLKFWWQFFLCVVFFFFVFFFFVFFPTVIIITAKEQIVNMFIPVLHYFFKR